jgi:regulatory subunit for Cdc7p protein kinase
VDPEVTNIATYAISVGKKVWNGAKLASVIERCQGDSLTSSHQSRTNAASANIASTKGNQKSLSQLLEHERLHGTTTERDPNSKRHDYTYFSKNHYFVLIEDLKQELAPIAVLQYPITKGVNGADTGTWPVLHCHPKARGPFIEFDEREEKRWRKAENTEREREREREQRRRRFEQRRRSLKENQFKAQHDLRRTVSMNNLHRRGILPEVIPDGDPDHLESANASGYLASGGYVAASGNSVGITSTTGTTSATTDGSLTKLPLPPSLRGRLQQEVVTSRRFGGSGKSKEKGDMGPPAEIPDRRGLRKSRSTNTLRLPKRDEGSKPGYCESCRVRFEDFKEVSSRRPVFCQSDERYSTACTRAQTPQVCC